MKINETTIAELRRETSEVLRLGLGGHTVEMHSWSNRLFKLVQRFPALLDTAERVEELKVEVAESKSVYPPLVADLRRRLEAMEDSRDAAEAKLAAGYSCDELDVIKNALLEVVSEAEEDDPKSLEPQVFVDAFGGPVSFTRDPFTSPIELPPCLKLQNSDQQRYRAVVA